MTCRIRRVLPGRNAYNDARADLETSRAELDRVRGQWPVVRELAAAMHRHRDRNHFADNLRVIFRGGNQ